MPPFCRNAETTRVFIGENAKNVPKQCRNSAETDPKQATVLPLIHTDDTDPGRRQRGQEDLVSSLDADCHVSIRMIPQGGMTLVILFSTSVALLNCQRTVRGQQVPAHPGAIRSKMRADASMGQRAAEVKIVLSFCCHNDSTSHLLLCFQSVSGTVISNNWTVLKASAR